MLNERIRKLRRTLNLTQQEFANRLGTARNNIAGYETGKRSPSSAVITLICREFGVNEIWLRTGEGGNDNMFTKIDEDDRYSINLGKLTVTENEFAKKLINTIAESSPEQLKYIEDFMKKCLGID